MRFSTGQQLIDKLRGKNKSITYILESFLDRIDIITPNDICLYKNIFYWNEIWTQYLIKNKDNLNNKITCLKKGLDEISIEYIDYIQNLLSLSKHEDNILLNKKYAMTDRDCLYLHNYIEMKNQKDFIYSNYYGLDDLPKNIFNKINGKTIIDGGAYIGDTSCLFNTIFPDSKIYAFEPLTIHLKQIENFIEAKGISDKIIPMQYGLSDRDETSTISYNSNSEAPGATFLKQKNKSKFTQNLQVKTIDNIFKDKNEEIGLIKLDIEGFESKAIKGAVEIIKKHKPVIIAALYHNPVDFYELKPFLESLNLNYKFMIRRSELTIPLADYVLIAFVED